MKRTLKTIIEDMCAQQIKSKSNGHIDFRTTIGRTTKSTIDRISNVDINADPGLKYIRQNKQADTASLQPPEVPDDNADLKTGESSTDEDDEDDDTKSSLIERVVRRIVAGEVVKSVDRQTQIRNANKNSSIPSAERKRIALKSARTRNKDKAGLRDAEKKRAKSREKRMLLNL